MRKPKDLKELLDAGIITEETAVKIQQFYEAKKNEAPSRLILIFGILGALLVGLGIILILAHNWDEIPRQFKTLIGFVPLLIGQIACGWTLLRKNNSIAWREGSAVFLFFAIGASIALIGQIYNIPGNLQSFLFTWALLALPLLYVMRSSMASLLYLIGITAYAFSGEFGGTSNLNFWLLLLAALPHYYLLLKEKPMSNFTNFHHWVIPIIVLMTLPIPAKDAKPLLFIAYSSLLGFFYLIGQLDYFKQKSIRSNGYLVIGSLGTLILFLILSFALVWEEIARDLPKLFAVIGPEVITVIITTVAALALLIYHLTQKNFYKLGPQSFMFILFIPMFLLGAKNFGIYILINIILFMAGVWTIRKGVVSNNLGILNYGLLIITSLIVLRFFDFDLSFVTRGILFVIIGLGFFLSNYLMTKNRKKAITNG